MSFAFFGGPRRAVDCRFYFPPATITFLNGTNKRIHSNRTATFSARAGPLDGIVAPLTGSRPCEQILDDLADLHELIQTGGLGDEFGKSQIPEIGRTLRRGRV